VTGQNAKSCSRKFPLLQILNYFQSLLFRRARGSKDVVRFTIKLDLDQILIEFPWSHRLHLWTGFMGAPEVHPNARENSIEFMSVPRTRASG
jgi:hypothetical protein